MTLGKRLWDDHPIRPAHIDPQGHFWGQGITALNQEQIFKAIVIFCQRRGDFHAPINKLELDVLWHELHGQESPRIPTGSLRNKGFTEDVDEDLFVVTHEFVTHAFMASPKIPVEPEAPQEGDPSA